MFYTVVKRKIRFRKNTIIYNAQNKCDNDSGADDADDQVIKKNKDDKAGYADEVVKL